MIGDISTLSIDSIGTIVAAFLTFFVFCFLLGDLPAVGSVFKWLYRLAVHILIGAGVAYALAVAWWSILYPRVALPLYEAMTRRILPTDPGFGTVVIAAVGLLLGFLLVLKLSRPLAGLGNISAAYLVGVGVGVAAGGAVIGTLFAQSQATWTLSGARTGPTWVWLWNVPILVIGTLCALISFTFTATGRKGVAGVFARFVQVLSGIGRFFVYMALGAAFAGVFVASVSVLIGRAQFVLDALTKLGLIR